MSATTQAAPVTAIDLTIGNTDSILDDLLDQLGDDTVLEAADAGVVATNLASDEVLEPADVVQPSAELAIEAADTGADLTDQLLDELAAAGDEAANKQLLEAPAEAPAKKKAAAKPATPKKGKKTTVPAGYGSDAEPDANDDKKVEFDPEKAKAASKKKATAPKAPAEPKAPKAPAEPRATKVTHSPGKLLMSKLGSAFADTLVFDINHTPEQMEAARNAFVERLDITKKENPEYIADKVRDKIQMLLVWLNRGGELNEVLKRTLTLLHKDGKVTSGDKGNLQVNLLAKPYSIGTARSQANQMFMALPALQIVIKDKGSMVPNPDSALLMAINAKLGLA